MFRSVTLGVVSFLLVGAAVSSTAAAEPVFTGARAQVIVYLEAQNENPGGATQDGGVQLLDLSTGVSRTMLLHQRVTSASVSPDGRTLLYGLYTSDDAAHTGLFTVALDGSSGPNRVSVGNCSAGSGQWSPDGTRIVLASSCGLIVVDAATDAVVRQQSGDFQYPVFSSDGSKVLFSDGGGDIQSYAIADGAFTHLGTGEQPVESPDGSTIAYRSLSDDNGVQGLWVMGADGSKPHQLTAATPDSKDDVTTLAWSADGAVVFAGVNTVHLDSLRNNDIYAVDRTNHYRRTVTATPDVNEDTISSGVTGRTAASRGSAFTAVSPTRVLDTRTGLGSTKAPLAAGATRDIKIADIAGVPADATAVTVNLTAINPSTGTYLTLLPTPTGTSNPPTTSTLNIAARQTQANGASIALGANGSIRLYNHSGTVNAALDITGYSTG